MDEAHSTAAQAKPDLVVEKPVQLDSQQRLTRFDD
jgi:hypothetical protein